MKVPISPIAIRSIDRPGPGCWFKVKVGSAVRADKTHFYFPVSEKGWAHAVFQARQGRTGPLSSLTKIILSCDKGGFRLAECGPDGRECSLDPGSDDPRDQAIAGMCRPARRRSR